MFVEAILKALGEDIEPAQKAIPAAAPKVDIQKELKPTASIVKQQPFIASALKEAEKKEEIKPSPAPIVKEGAVFELSLEPKKNEE